MPWVATKAIPFVFIACVIGAAAAGVNKKHFSMALRQPQPSPYPRQFSINFFTNVTASTSTTTTTKFASASDDNNVVAGKLWYDWELKVQRIDHGAGAYECVRFYQTSHPCTLIFTTRGMYRILYDHDGDDDDDDDDSMAPRCCLDLEGVGPPPPDWARREAANATFSGWVQDETSGLDALEWIFEINNDAHHRAEGNFQTVSPPLPYHSMRQVATGPFRGRPLTFTFPGKAMGRQDYHYEVSSMMVGPQEAFLFHVPDDCLDLACPKSQASKQ